MAAYAALTSLAQATDLSRSQDRYSFSIHAEEKIRSIHEYVIFMLSFLEDLPEKAYRWERRISDVAYQIEDIIEPFMWQQTQSRYMPMRSPSVELEDQLKDVTVEIGLIAGEMLEERPAYLPAAAVPSTPATTVNDAVIGLDDDLLSLKERLCGQSLRLQVIPIVGMAGIGKTTLARTIYEDQLILGHFDIRAWVTVSQDYSPHRLGRILLGLVDAIKLSVEGEEKACENLEKQPSGEKIKESEMATKIYQNLKARRYLVVMDDIWSTKVWDDVRYIFPDDNNGSRIMLTTRLLDLAAYTNPDSRFHEMQFMDDDQCWNLLKQKVFGNRNFPYDLEEVGKEIARRCVGLPLAVVLVAGVLSAVNTTRDSWEEIARNVNPVVERELEEILSFSYTHLPHHLRPCFLFIGGFPEDESIHASTLIKLWVAEGFVKHEKGCSKSLEEEEAEEYLEDLVKRNLVLVVSRKINGKIKSCNLHDAVRDLCIRKAHQEKFLRVMDGRHLPQGLMNERRISYSNIDNILGPTIRTIMCFQLQESLSWLDLLQSSRLLKVLNAVGSNQQEFPLPSQLFQLFHLTYLALIGSFNIPSAISKLVNLQTLIIHPTFGRQRKRNLREYENASHFSLPLEIWRMRQLRHLLLYDLYTLPHPPKSDGSDLLPLENLQTLSLIEDLEWNEKMVQMIPNAKNLRLVYSDNEGYRLRHLKSLHQLEKLRVTGYQQFSWQGRNPSFPPSLKKLSLVGGGFPWEDMTILGSLPNLQVLKLLDFACDGQTWETADEEFPELKYLLIDESHLRHWITQSNPFPKLQSLVLRSCWRLGEIPEAIGESTTLEFIEVAGYCRSTLLESVEQIKEYQRSIGNDAFQVKGEDEDIVGLEAKMHKLQNIVEEEDKLLSAIQTLESWVVEEMWKPYREELDGLITELRMIVDFLRDKKLGEKIRVYYLIGDLVEIVREALDDDENIWGLRRWVVEAKKHMLQSGADGAEVENIVEGEDEDVVGLEEDVKLLLQRAIFNEERQFWTLSITGKVGIGKTTLVRKVYNHADVIDQFECRAWVCMSRILSHTEVLMKLIQQVVDPDQLQRLEKMERADNTSLQEMLHQHLKGMRYFIVLDDLQKEMRLESVLKALPDEDQGSRLLLISRSYNIDTGVDYYHQMKPLDSGKSWNIVFIDYYHQMKPLDFGKSWKLFVKTIFRGTSEHILSKHLEEKLRVILKKCDGLPLAIKEVGRQLAEKRRSGWEWEQICASTLELAYNKMDPDLKLCFLHLAFFKENTTMRTEKLMQIWDASPDIDGEPSVYGLTDFNMSILSYSVQKLTEESIIEEEDKSCRINAILHRLSIKKAEEEMGFEIRSNSGNINRPSLSPRHCVVICSRDKFNYSASQDKHLISLFFHGGGYFDATPSYWESFEQLRILDLEDFGLKILPDSIGSLTELRYLGLRNNHIKELPQSLGCLKKLEVLDIALNFMVEVSNIIWEMESLCHLYMSDVIFRTPLKIDALQNLQTLTYISFDDLIYDLLRLQMMTSLWKLGIREVDEKSDVSKLFASLAELDELYSLVLRGCRFRSMPCLDELGILHGLRTLKLDGLLPKLPSANNFPPNLKVLKLVNSCLDEDPMPVLEKLPMLEHLKLRNAYTGQQMVILHNGFPWLHDLCIEELWKLRNIQVGKGAMRFLVKLEICNCPYLETLPEEIASMTYLKELVTVTTKNVAAQSFRSWA